MEDFLLYEAFLIHGLPVVPVPAVVPQVACDTNIGIILSDGTCKPCKAYTRPDFNGESCIRTVCFNTQILKIDGNCSECPAFTRPSVDGKTCIALIAC